MVDKKAPKQPPKPRFTPLDQLPAPSAPEPGKRSVGRPSEYNPEVYPDQARKLCLLGATDVELAEFFDVSSTTIDNWKSQHPEFLGSIRAGKIQADAEIGSSLYERARGFEWDEAQPIKVKEVLYQDGKRTKEIERVETVMVHKIVPPDATSMIFWLKNRRPKEWRDRVEHTGAEGGPLEISWQMPIAAPLPGDTARDVTPVPVVIDAVPEPTLGGGEAVAVEWGDSAASVSSGNVGEKPGARPNPKRGAKP